MKNDVLPGRNFPIGATYYDDGVNFSVYSKRATELELLLFDDVDDQKPSRIIPFDSDKNKTYYYWHMFIPKMQKGQLYAFRAHGPFLPEYGYRFNEKKVLIDPCAKAVAYGKNYSREAAISDYDNCAQSLKSVIADMHTYDWEGDYSPAQEHERMVIYELHVGGFTKNPNSGVSENKRGTYAGLIEKISYLKSLGVTAVELMPVQQFDEQDAPYNLKNYWGYSPVAFFAPHSGYSSRKDYTGAVDEFRDMVKALHKAGMKVIIDVVFNHTSEGDQNGPVFSFKGLENATYYILEKNRALYKNYSGCGNTVNANHSIVRRLIENCLCYWVKIMHVDGFRFDLASVMARGEKGEPLENPPILWAIESNPILAGTKFIAETWDAAGLYQLGSFIGERFAEWNGMFRDDVRRFIKGDCGVVPNLAKRICGSPDIFNRQESKPIKSVNFVACHDGFTLNDLVSYNDKHNQENLEHNRDGSDYNLSWNCGAEGPTEDREIDRLRIKQIKNFLTVLFISQGTPMLLMGDEVRRSQNGNNNAYCQDNVENWFNWEDVKKNADILEFVKKLVHYTKNNKVFFESEFWVCDNSGQERCAQWHGVKLDQPDWSDSSHTLAFTLRDKKNCNVFHIMLNAYWEPLEFELPCFSKGEKWRRVIDTSLQPPNDFCDPQKASFIEDGTYKVESRSIAILFARE